MVFSNWYPFSISSSAGHEFKMCPLVHNYTKLDLDINDDKELR